MRAQPFLNFLAQYYNPAVASNLASVAGINGGWEVWLQVEIARCFFVNDQGTTCTREEPYPSGLNPNQYLTYNTLNNAVGNTANAGNACRCDFYLHRNNQNIVDDTYIELKCINPNAANPLADVWNRFGADFTKANAVYTANNALNCIALLATFGVFTPADVGGANPNLGALWAGNHSAYVWDPANNAVTTLQTVTTDGANRFFLLAVAI